MPLKHETNMQWNEVFILKNLYGVSIIIRSPAVVIRHEIPSPMNHATFSYLMMRQNYLRKCRTDLFKNDFPD